MKNAALIFLLFFFCDLNLFAQNVNINNILSTPFTSSNLPIIVINTNGQEILDEVKITADMGIIYNGEGLRNNLTDPFNNYNGKIGIEIRGSSSQQFPKKQYAVETRDDLGNDLKVSLLGFPKESDWVLFAPYNDKSLMRDALSYRIASDMGRYASRSKFCEVVLNGDYVGVYVLLEKIKRDANRVNIKKLEAPDTSGTAVTGGYIIKIDKTDGEGNDGWYSRYLPFDEKNNQIFYQYHFPKPEDIVWQQKNFIQNKILHFETVMKYALNLADQNTGFPAYINTDSFVDFVLANEVTKNVDAYRLSTFLYKNRDDVDPKIYAGPVWDFNLAFGNADYYEGWKTDGWQIELLTDIKNIPDWETFLTPFWWKKLFEDSTFQSKIYARWQYLRSNSLETSKVLNYVDSLVTLLDEAKTRNFERWPVLGQYVWPNPFIGNTYQEEINYLKNWIIERLNWLDKNMVGEPTDVGLENNSIPNQYVLLQNYPNPFNPSTKIIWQSPISGWQSLSIYDILGNKVATLIDEYKPAGNYSITFNAEDYKLSSGIYICKYQIERNTYLQKLVLIK